MGWFEKRADRPAIPPEKALWAVCPKCAGRFSKEAWKAASAVCPKCGYNGRIGARARIAITADDGASGMMLQYQPTLDTVHTNAWLEAHGIPLVLEKDGVG